MRFLLNIFIPTMGLMAFLPTHTLAQRKIIHAWSKQILCCDNNIATDAVELPKGLGYVVVGQRFMLENDIQTASEVALISRRGEVRKNRHTAEQYKGRFDRVHLTSDGELFLVGHQNGNLTLVKLDFELNEIERYTYGDVTVIDSDPPELVETNTGFMLVNSINNNINVVTLDKNFKLMNRVELKDTINRMHGFNVKSAWYDSKSDQLGLSGWCCSSVETRPCNLSPYGFVFMFDISSQRLQRTQIFASDMYAQRSAKKGDTITLVGSVEWKEVDDRHSKGLVIGVTTSGKEMWRSDFHKLRQDWFNSAIYLGDSLLVAGASYKPGVKEALLMIMEPKTREFTSVINSETTKSWERAEYYHLAPVSDGFIALGMVKGSWLISRFIVE